MSLRTVSYGGGVQSTALLVLAAQRVIDFPIFVMANAEYHERNARAERDAAHAEVAKLRDDSHPHYTGTYCIHGLHEQCKRTCKTCSAPCQCSCHAPAGPVSATANPAVASHGLAAEPQTDEAWRDYTLEGGDDFVYAVCRSDDACEGALTGKDVVTYLTLGEAVDWAKEHSAAHVWDRESEERAAADDEVRAALGSAYYNLPSPKPDAAPDSDDEPTECFCSALNNPPCRWCETVGPDAAPGSTAGGDDRG